MLPVQPTTRKTRHVSSKVATVIPDIGLDEEPISPVRREETVTKRNPKMTIRIAPSQFIWRVGAAQIRTIAANIPPATNFIDKSWSVRTVEACVLVSAWKSANPERNP